MSVDLRITGVETDKSQYSSGDDITVDWQVRNSGTTDAATTSSGVYLFTANYSDNWFLGSQSAGASPANTFDNETDTFELPSNLDAGNYILSVLADYDLRVDESNEFNNAANANISIIAALPNLIISDVEVGNQDLSEGELVTSAFAPGGTFSVTVDIENDGSGAADASILGLYLVRNGVTELVDTNSTKALSPGSTDTGETLSFTIPSNLAVGQYELLIKADYNDAIDESNIGDNIQSFFIDVGEPDLVPQQVTIDGEAVLPGEVVSQSYASGDDISIAWEIWNTGDGTAGSNEAGVYLVSSDGTPVASVFNSTKLLEGGDKDTGETSTLSLPDDLSPGRYTVRVAADASEEVAESTEGNNFYAFEIDVADAPSPDSVREGTDTTTNLLAGTWIQGAIDPEPISGDEEASDGQGGFIDKDWYRITLDEDRTFTFDARSVSLSTGIVFARLYDSNGNAVGGSAEAEGSAASFSYSTAGQSGSQTFYIAVSAGDMNDSDFRTATGDFQVRYLDEGAVETGDVAGDITTSESLQAGATIIGEIQQNDADGSYIDTDYYRANLTGGQRYTFSADSSVDDVDALEEVFIRLRDAQGGTLSTDVWQEGESPSFIFDAPGVGQQTYYLAVSAGGDADWWNDTGDYSLSLTSEGVVPQPVNYRPVAEATDYVGDPGDIVPLTELFHYSDLDGLSDIVSFAVQDRTRDGGHLTYLKEQMDPNVIYERPISELKDWAFVVGLPGTDYVGFNAIDDDGAVSTSAVAAVSGAQLQGPEPLASAEDLFGTQKLSILAQFAAAAYFDQFQIVSDLDQDGWNFLSQQELSVTGDFGQELMSGNYFINGVAFENWVSLAASLSAKRLPSVDGVGSAIVAESPDKKSLVISFTGTDSFVDWVQNLLTIDSHFDLFDPLFRALGIEAYLENPEHTVYVTGHSLGAAMAQKFVQEYGELGNVVGVGLANPGLLGEVQQLDNFVSILVEGDPIVIPSYFTKYLGTARSGDVIFLVDQNENSDFTLRELHDDNLYLSAAEYLNYFSSDIFANIQDGRDKPETKYVSIGATRYISEPFASIIYPDRIETSTATDVEFRLGISPEFSVAFDTTVSESTPQLRLTSSDFTATNWQVSASGNLVEVRNRSTGEVLFYVDDFTSVQFYSGNAPFEVSLAPLEGTDIGPNTIYFTGGLANDNIQGAATDRRIVATGGDGEDTLIGGTTDDHFSGNGGNDSLNGGGGNDTLQGGGDNDMLLGGAGNDFQRGGRGQDEIYGGEGDDSLRGQREGDKLFGGAGNDNLKGGGGNDTLYGENGSDFLKGGSRRDEIFGGVGNDRLLGNSFDDLLEGGAGEDRLIAGGENDTLDGGTGNDFLRGGTGEDTFIFNPGDGMDTFDDFNFAEDNLQLGNFGLTAQQVEDLAQTTNGDLVIAFSASDSITLDGVTSPDGLAELISFV